jgi:integrase
MLCRKCKKEIPAESTFCLHCGVKQEVPKRSPKRRGNGQGTVFKRGTTYTAMKTKRINGRKVSVSKGGFEKKKDALDYLPNLTFDNVARRAPIALTFGMLYKEWAEVAFHDMSVSRKTAYKKAYERCKPLWDRLWSDLLVVDMQKVVNEQAETFYPKRDMRNLMSQMAKHAIENDYHDKNYAQYIKLPELIEKETPAFSNEEVIALWKDYQNGNDFSGYIVIMLFTGMSYGDLNAQMTENIHLDERYMIGGVKTRKRKTTEIIFPEFLKEVIERLAGEDKLLEMSEETFRKQFDIACIRAGVSPLKPHSCRHTYLTRLALEDVQAAIIQEMGRHTNYKTTLRYTHIQRAPKLDAAEKLAQLLLTDDQQDGDKPDK